MKKPRPAPPAAPKAAPRHVQVAVAILGAGPAGATLAARLAAAGVPTAVVDHAPLPPMEMPAFDGRAYAIALASQKLLDAAGVWARLPGPPCPIERIHVADGRPGERPSRFVLDFDHATVGDDPFGWMVEARSLRIALNASLPQLANLEVFAPAKATAQRSAAGAELLLEDGTRITAQLLVAAEGRRSMLRQQAGIGTARLDYRTTAMVGAFAHSRPHGNEALEQFLPHGPFAQLPLSGSAEHPNMSAFVWAERPAIAERALALSDAAFSHELARRMAGRFGEVQVLGRRWSYPLTAMHASRYYDTRLALVGDAAHGIHPIAGQGLNLGFRDVAVLADLLIEGHAAGADLGDGALLARYQARRRPDSLVMLGATHALERLFGNDIPPLRVARRLGIAAVERIPFLKRAFARSAMGLPLG